MLRQLKRLWKRWAIYYGCSRHHNNNYTILPRRRNLHKSKPVCRFLGEFYCVCDYSLSAFLLLFAAVALTIILVIICNGVTVSGTLFFIGWRPPAVISISLLNTLDEANFPQDETAGAVVMKNARKHYAENNDTLANSDNGIFWKVDGFSKYIEEFSDDPDILGMFGKLPSGKNLDREGYGFWVYKSLNFTATPNGGVASIRALRITDHMNVDPKEIEVAVAIRAYIDGEATIVIKYEESLTGHVHTEEIKREEFQGKGFCYKILDVPFDKKINMIHMRATSTNLRRHGIVIVDRVLVVVAKLDVTESVMHTLVPNNWC